MSLNIHTCIFHNGASGSFDATSSCSSSYQIKDFLRTEELQVLQKWLSNCMVGEQTGYYLSLSLSLCACVCVCMCVRVRACMCLCVFSLLFKEISQ